MRDNKILSQTEIEALLAGEALLGGDDDSGLALAEPEADPAEALLGIPAPELRAPRAAPPPVPNRPAKLYDFRRPDKFSKEHLRSLRILHESFARMLGSSLTSYLSAGVQVRLTMLEQGTYDEYIQSLPTPTVIYVVGLAPLRKHSAHQRRNAGSWAALAAYASTITGPPHSRWTCANRCSCSSIVGAQG